MYPNIGRVSQNSFIMLDCHRIEALEAKVQRLESENKDVDMRVYNNLQGMEHFIIGHTHISRYLPNPSILDSFYHSRKNALCMDMKQGY